MKKRYFVQLGSKDSLALDSFAVADMAASAVAWTAQMAAIVYEQSGHNHPEPVAIWERTP